MVNSFRDRSPAWLDPIWDSFERFSCYGHQLTKFGTLAVGKRKIIQAGEASWVHTAAIGLPDELLDNLELDLGFRYYNEEVLVSGLPKLTEGYDFDHFVPSKIKDLLRSANGMRLFCGHLTISGILSVPPEMKKFIHEDLPLTEGAMTDMNIFNRPKLLKPKILLIGGYGYNGSLIYVKEGTEEVFCCDKNGKELARWGSLEDWITIEMQRLSNLFDAKSLIFDPSVPTNPRQQSA